jgi:putative flippase GtrA
MASQSPRRLPLPGIVRRALEVEFIKYGLVGASNTLITYASYSVLVLVGVPYLVALLVGYIPGGLNSYLLNRHSGTRFAVVQGCAIAANFVLLYLFVHDLQLNKYLSQAILTVPVVLVTFFINRTWTFNRGDGDPLASQPASR